MTKLHALWLGQLPLGEMFWTWAIGVGLFVNVATSGLFLTLVSLDRPWAALLAGYGASVPYNVLVLVGVWRAAGRYEGPAGLRETFSTTTATVLIAILMATR